jgi:hypothetical protein
MRGALIAGAQGFKPGPRVCIVNARNNGKIRAEPGPSLAGTLGIANNNLSC